MLAQEREAVVGGVNKDRSKGEESTGAVVGGAKRERTEK